MDFVSFEQIDELHANAFVGFKSINELCLDSRLIPDTKGVYLILNFNTKPIEFLAIGSGGFFKGKNPNVEISELQSNWVEKTIVVYIGKATSLRKRLGQYFSFGQGKNIGHYGGRYIWQLKNSKDLIVCWKSLTNSDPRELEKELIKLFVSKFGKKPFANLTG